MLSGILAGLAAGALWGLVFVAPRMIPMGAGGYASVDLAAGRFAVYGLVAAAVMLLGLGRRRWPTARQAAAALGMSLLGFSGYYLLLVLAIRDAGTEMPSLIIGTIPLWIMLLGKPTDLRWAALLPGLALTLAGLLLMMGATHDAGTGAGLHFWRGIGFALMALVSWTAFAILNSAWFKRHPEINATDWANWLGVATGLGALLVWLASGSDVQVLAARDDASRFALLCCVVVHAGRVRIDLAGHHFVEHRQPAAQRQPVRAAHRERNPVCLAVFFCLGWPLANVDPALRLCAVHAGNTCLHQGSSLSLAKIKTS